MMGPPCKRNSLPTCLNIFTKKVRKAHNICVLILSISHSDLLCSKVAFVRRYVFFSTKTTTVTTPVLWCTRRSGVSFFFASQLLDIVSFYIQGKTYIYESELGQCIVFPDRFFSVEESLEILRNYDVCNLVSIHCTFLERHSILGRLTPNSQNATTHTQKLISV